MKNLIATLSLIALLGGCADMGHIQPRATALDADTLSGGAQFARNAAANTWPSERWWQAYHDPQLDALIQRALQDSPGLREAYARSRQAASMTGLAEAAGKPTLEAKMSLRRELFSEHDFIPAPEAGNYAWYNRVALEAGYDLDLWGKHRDALAASLAEKQVADAEAQLARLTLEQAIVRSYVDLSLAHTLKDIAEERLVHRKQAVAVMHRRLIAGLASEVEATQLDATLPPLQLEIENQEERITLLHNRLAALTGQAPQAGEHIQRPAMQLADANNLALPSNLPADLLGRRPDVQASRWSVEAAAREINVAKAAFYPDINLRAFIGFQAIGFGRFLGGESSVRGVGPAVSLPIFDGGALRANLGARTAAYDAAVERYNGTLLHALESVAGRLTVSQSVARQLQLNSKALATAERTRMLAQKGVAAGMTDYLVLLDSEVNLLARQQDQARLVARQLESYAELMLALGGGIQPQVSASSVLTETSNYSSTLTGKAGQS